MPGLLTSQWATAVLEMRIARREPEPLVLKLFVNDPLIGADMTADDLQEPVGQGYQPVVLKPEGWTVQPAAAGRRAVATYPEVVFVFQGPLPDPIRGYFIVGADTGILAAVERFLDDRPIRFLGDAERITVSLVQP